jgi:energy-coupling factor transporter ATP-binding protein EcfA2
MNLITRPIIKKIKSQLEKGDIVVLIEARQVGKTSILLKRSPVLLPWYKQFLYLLCFYQRYFLMRY